MFLAGINLKESCKNGLVYALLTWLQGKVHVACLLKNCVKSLLVDKYL